MERMKLLSHGMHIVVEPTHMGANEARIFWGHVQFGMVIDDPKQGACTVGCVHDGRFESRAYGRQDHRISAAVDRLVGHLLKLAADRHTPPKLETVGDEDDE